MKNILAIHLATAALTMSGHAAIITNGSFESGLAGWRPLNQAPPEGCFADHSEDYHDLLGVVESSGPPIQKNELRRLRAAGQWG